MLVRLPLLLTLALVLSGTSLLAPAASAAPDPPQCVVAPCCASGDLGCRIDYYRGEKTRLLCGTLHLC